MSKSTLICLVISLILYLMNAKYFVAMFVNRPDMHSESYTKMKKYDKNDYQYANPATEILSKKRNIEKYNKRWFR